MKSIVLLTLVLALTATTATSRRLGRIHGGTEAPIADYPYQLSLELRGQHHCGATVVSHIYVLTSAMCVDGFTPEDVGLRAGTARREDGGSVHAALTITEHSGYNYYTRDFNIAVVLVVPFVFGNEVAALPLAPAGNVVAPGTAGVVTGWGLQGGTDQFAFYLKEVAVSVVDRDACAAAYTVANVTISATMLCAAGVAGDGPCWGDNGGPLAVGGVLVAVSSFDSGCGNDAFPAVFTDVGAVRDWIDENMPGKY